MNSVLCVRACICLPLIVLIYPVLCTISALYKQVQHFRLAMAQYCIQIYAIISISSLCARVCLTEHNVMDTHDVMAAVQTYSVIVPHRLHFTHSWG
jgi:hypothetical protein